MPPLTPGTFLPVIEHAARLGVSGSETLRILRSFGYQQRTQAFFQVYRQARAAALAVPELSIMSNSAYVPSSLMREGGQFQRYPYQYYVRYDTLHGETGETRTAYYTLGSSTPLKKGQILEQGAELARGALQTTNVVLTDIQLERASVRPSL